MPLDETLLPVVDSPPRERHACLGRGRLVLFSVVGCLGICCVVVEHVRTSARPAANGITSLIADDPSAPHLRPGSREIGLAWFGIIAFIAARLIFGGVIERIRMDFADISDWPRRLRNAYSVNSAFDLQTRVRPVPPSLWAFASLSIIMNAAIVAMALPGLFAAISNWTIRRIALLVFGVLLLRCKLNHIDYLTLEGNLQVTASSEKSEGLTDGQWALSLKIYICAQLVSFFFIVPRPSELHFAYARACSYVYYGSMIIEWLRWVFLCFDFAWQTRNNPKHAFASDCTDYWSNVVWIVRRRNQRWNRSIDNHWYVVYLGFLAPSRWMDRTCLDERLRPRLGDRCCKALAVSNGWPFDNGPFTMTKEIRGFIDYPMINSIDIHTRLMLYVVKGFNADACRVDQIFTPDIKPPIQKMEIDVYHQALAGLKLATWDAQYTPEEREDGTPVENVVGLKTTCFLWLLTKSKSVEKPFWFANEFEGVMTYEALARSFAPRENVHWKDLVSDNAFKLLAFNGLAQAWLAGRNSATVRKTVKKFEVPDEAHYIIDFSGVSTYDVRPKMAQYGFIACFTKSQEPLCIYVCHWQTWVWRPKAPSTAPTWASSPPPSPSKSVGTAEGSSQSLAQAAVAAVDEADEQRWEHAKFVAKTSMAACGKVKEHLLHCHWIVANTASLASRTCLSQDHPVRRLLHVFLFRTAAVNYSCGLTQLPEHLFLHRTTAFDYEELCRYLEDAAKSWKFETFSEVVAGRELGALEKELPWASDGMNLWSSFEDFTMAFLALYYDSDEAVLNDPEVTDFWQMVNDNPAGPAHMRKSKDAPRGARLEGDSHFLVAGCGYKLPELGSKRGALQNLTDYIVHVMFWVTGNHELYGAIGEYLTTPMGLSYKIWDERVPENGLMSTGQVMSDVQGYVQSLCINSSLGFSQPRLLSDWAFLLHIQEADAATSRWGTLKLDDQQARQVKSYINSHRPGKKPVLGDLLGHNGLREDSLEPGGANSRVGDFRDIQADDVNGSMTSRLGDIRDVQVDISKHNSLLTGLHAAFVRDLVSVSSKLEELNRKRSQPFQAFNPINLQTSVSM